MNDTHPIEHAALAEVAAALPEASTADGNTVHAWGRAVSEPPVNLQTEAYETGSLAKKLRRQVGQASIEYNMLENGDKVMVCLSGGKDSYGMLDILLQLQPKAPVKFEIIAFNLDQGHPGFPSDLLPNYLKSLGVRQHIEFQDTYTTVKRVIPEGKTMCSLCSRLRRGVIYRVAKEIGATKIALGHHREDILETFFLNLFYGGRLKSMPPKLTSDNGEHVVIRPLAYVAERDLARYAALRQFPIIPCDLCGSQENLMRKQIKNMISGWDKTNPGRVENMFRALQNTVPSHLLDRQLFDFFNLSATGIASESGDKVFDKETFTEKIITEDAENEPKIVNWHKAKA